jgi:hypothetical protein
MMRRDLVELPSSIIEARSQSKIETYKPHSFPKEPLTFERLKVESINWQDYRQKINPD